MFSYVYVVKIIGRMSVFEVLIMNSWKRVNLCLHPPRYHWDMISPDQGLEYQAIPDVSEILRSE